MFHAILRAAGKSIRRPKATPVALSTRIRLARNLNDFPFPGRAETSQRREILSKCMVALGDLRGMTDSVSSEMDDLSDLDKQILVEQHLISPELSQADDGAGLVLSKDRSCCVMINEEDHLRIQVMHSGLALDSAWKRINEIDDLLEENLTYAFHPRFGYLTACPTNVGTGMRVSVMLHLPALVITRQIEKVFRSLQKISLAVRGLYGEGSQAMGDFYQISNQITLGRSEQELLQQVNDVVPVLIDYERKARQYLVRESQKDLHDRVSRAFGILCTAQTISSEETMHLLSSVRMGINLGLIENLEIPMVNQLFIHTQPAHLQKIRGSELDTADRNIERAHYLKNHLRKPNDDSAEKN